MRKLNAADIQVFVGGALAVEGFRSVMAFLQYSVVTTDRLVWLPFAASALALPLGIAILLRRSLAFQFAVVYLGVVVALSCVALTTAIYISGTSILAYPVMRMIWRPLPIPVLLLVLLGWSRSRRFAHDHDV